MYVVVFMCLLYECLLPSSATVTITIHRGFNSSSIKLKIGTINISNSEKKPVQHPVISHAATENDYSASNSRGNPSRVEKERGKTLAREANLRGDRYGKKERSKIENTDSSGLPTVAVKPEDTTENIQMRNSRPRTVGSTRLHRRRRKVMDDDRIRKFSAHVYKQTLKAFEAMKQKSNQYTQKKIDVFANSYKEKFADFVRATRQANIKTKDATRNVILHTIETSNVILQRIVNFLKADDMTGSASTIAARQGRGETLQKEVDTVQELEYNHACSKFGICRSGAGFTNTVQDILSILLQLPDDKLLQAHDAFDEVAKTADWSSLAANGKIPKALKELIDYDEQRDAGEARIMYSLLYAVISKAHLPLSTDNAAPEVKDTTSLHTVLAAMEEALPPTADNKREWTIVKSRLKRWKDGQTLDIVEIMKEFVNNIIKGFSQNKQAAEKVMEFITKRSKIVESMLTS